MLNRSELLLSIVEKVVEQKNECDKGAFDTLKEVDEQENKGEHVEGKKVNKEEGWRQMKMKVNT